MKPSAGVWLDDSSASPTRLRFRLEIHGDDVARSFPRDASDGVKVPADADPLHVVFVSEAIPFPFGLASSVRIRLLARAIAAGGGAPRVMVVQPAMPRGLPGTQSVSATGDFAGVPYEYLCGVAQRPDSFTVRRMTKAWGYFRTLARLVELRRGHRLDVIVLVTRRLATIRAIGLLGRTLGVPVVLEMCEWPLAEVETMGGNRTQATRYCEHFADSISGAITISRYIRDRVAERTATNTGPFPTLLVPALADVDTTAGSGEVTGSNLVLCATLRYRPMIESSLLALQSLVASHPDLQLTILGGLSTPAERQWLDDRIASLSLSKHVVNMPYVSDADLVRVYGSAYALLAPLDDTPQNRSRFPNKIVEYLASGRPVITNGVGDVPLYLQHRRDAYLLTSSDPAAIAEGVEALLGDSSLATRIGAGGRLAAERSFDYRVHAASLTAFLERVASRTRNRVEPPAKREWSTPAQRVSGSPKVRPAEVLASRVTVVMQGGMFKSGGQYYMDGLWWDYLRDRLLRQCRSMTVVAPASPSSIDRFAQAPVDDPRVSVHEIRGWPQAVFVLAREVRRADLVWIFMPTLRGMLSGFLCRAFRIPYVVYLGSGVELSSQRLPRWATRALGSHLLRGAGAVVAAGGELATGLRRLRPDVEATIPAIGVSASDLRETETRLAKREGPLADWLYVGNLGKRKRPDVILAAFARFHRVGRSQATLHMVGGQPSAELRALVTALGVQGHVRWHGYVENGPELYAVYRSCGVFVLASEAEGFPRVLYEAMAFGVPIVTTPVGGVPFLLEDGRDCLMVPMDDPAALAESVSRLLNDEHLRTSIVENALRVVEGILASNGEAQVRRLVERAIAGSRL